MVWVPLGTSGTLSDSSEEEEYSPLITTVLQQVDSSRLHLTFVVFCLSFVNNSEKNIITTSTNKSSWPDSGPILRP